MNELEATEKGKQLSSLVNRRNKAKTKRIRKKIDKKIHPIVAMFQELVTKDNDYIHYSVMLRGGRKNLTWKQDLEIVDVALLCADYEHLKRYIN